MKKTLEIEATRTKFLRLRHIWTTETQHMSAVSTMIKHPAYRAIISMGAEVVPYIIDDMRTNNTPFWYYAIHELLGECPEIPDYAAGRIHLINDLYLAWWDDREGKRNLLWTTVTVIENERRSEQS